MDASEFRVIAKSVIDEIVAYDESISQYRVSSNVEPGYLRQLLPDSAPQNPEPFQRIRGDIESKILPGITHWKSPRFMGYFPCGTSYAAEIAELYSNAFTGAYFNWACSPAVTELESIVLDWLVKALGLPQCFLSEGLSSGGGVIHTSASESILLTMAVAREKYLREKLALVPVHSKEEEEWRLRSKLVVLGSSFVHSSTKKAAKILGVRFVEVEALPEDDYAMQGKDLAATLAELFASGLEPFYITVTLGTTDICATDDFAGIRQLLGSYHGRQLPIWVHVDAAYAGAVLLLEEYQGLANDFKDFHSFNFGPHKWMLTSFDCSVTFVRDCAEFTSAFSIQPPYLQNDFTSGFVMDYRNWQIGLGRRFRSLKLWFVLRSYGLRGLRTHLRSGIALAESLETKLRQRPDLFTIFTRARYALVSFQTNGETVTQINRRTEELFKMIQNDGIFVLTATVIYGSFIIRVCTSGAKTRDSDIQLLYKILIDSASKILSTPYDIAQ